MQETLHITINDPHAHAIIENLEKMHAVDFLTQDDDIDIPKAVKEETKKKLELLRDHPESAVSMQDYKIQVQRRLAK